MTETGTARSIPLQETPNGALIRKWSEVQRHADRAGSLVYRAELLFQNVITTYRFANTRGIPLEPIDPELERRFLGVQAEFMRIRDIVRQIEDREMGARWTGSDFDAVSVPALSGVFIPIAVGIGVVALAGLIARLVYVEKEATDLGAKFNAILKKTDAKFCADPLSPNCIAWKEEKKNSGYVKAKTMAETIQGAVSSIGGGLGTGLMIAVPLALFAIWRRKHE